MSLRQALGAPAAALATALGLWITLRRWPDAPRRPNHRGDPLPLVLGLAFGFGVSGAALVADLRGPAADVGIGTSIVLLAGLIDDLRGGGGARGIRGHLRSLLRGRFTTGILKILVGFVAAYFAVNNIGGSVGRQVLGVFVIAGATNLWNVLDVAPGRALKFFLPIQLALLAGVWGTVGFDDLMLWALIPAALVLPFDVREVAMLGDAGSNPLGFLIGVGCYLALPTPALGIVLVAILGLQFLGETLTLSAAIEAVPPLRWYDRLGRPPGGSAPRFPTESGPGS